MEQGAKYPLCPLASAVLLSEIKRRNRGAWGPGKPTEDSSAKGTALSTQGQEKSGQAGRPEALAPRRKSQKTSSLNLSGGQAPWTYFNSCWHRWWLLLFYLSLGPRHWQQKGVAWTVEVERLGDTGLDVYGGWSPVSRTLSGLQVKASSKWREKCRRVLVLNSLARVGSVFHWGGRCTESTRFQSYLHLHTPCTQGPGQETGCHQLLKSPPVTPTLTGPLPGESSPELQL